MMKNKLSGFLLIVGFSSASALTGCGGGGGAAPPPPPKTWQEVGQQTSNVFVPDNAVNTMSLVPVAKTVPCMDTKVQQVVVPDYAWVPTSTWMHTEQRDATQDVVVATMNLVMNPLLAAGARPANQAQSLAAFSTSGNVTLSSSRSYKERAAVSAVSTSLKSSVPQGAKLVLDQAAFQQEQASKAIDVARKSGSDKDIERAAELVSQAEEASKKAANVGHSRGESRTSQLLQQVGQALTGSLNQLRDNKDKKDKDKKDKDKKGK